MRQASIAPGWGSSGIPSIAKMAARMGQCFSAMETLKVPLEGDTVQDAPTSLEDSTRCRTKSFPFLTASGMISTSLLEKVIIPRFREMLNQSEDKVSSLLASLSGVQQVHTKKHLDRRGQINFTLVLVVGQDW